MRAIATGAPATSGSQAFACFLLGRLLALAGCDDEVLTHYARGNRLVHASFAGGGTLRGPEQFQRWWAPRARGAAGGLPCAEPQRRAAACPARLVTGQELGGLHEAVEPCTGEPLERIEALRTMAEDAPAARRLIDTAPPNLWGLGYLAALHPEVPVILCRRDPLDLVAALFCMRFSSGHAYSYEQGALGRMLALAEQAIALWAQRLPNPIQLVDYEQLVSDPLGTRRRLLTGLGLETGSDPELRSEVNGFSEGTTLSPGLHASHSPEGYCAIVSDLVGFGQWFARQLEPMLESYARRRELLQLAV